MPQNEKDSIWTPALGPHLPNEDPVGDMITNVILNAHNLPRKLDPLFARWKKIIGRYNIIINNCNRTTSPLTLQQIINQHQDLLQELQSTENELKERNIQHSAEKALTLCSETQPSNMKKALQIFSKTNTNDISNHRHILQPDSLPQDDQQRHLSFWDSVWNRPFSDPTLTTWLSEPSPDPPPWSLDSAIPMSITQPISLDELEATIQSFPNNRAPGPSLPTIEVYKRLPPPIMIILLHTMNSILVSHEYPDAWRPSQLILLNKKPPLDDPNNYRPINLLEMPFRILEKILHFRLKPWVDACLKPNQFGFRQHRGTPEMLLTLQSILENNETLFITNLDMKKAYDSSPQELVIKSMAAH